MASDITIHQVSKLLDEKLTPIQKTLNKHGRMLNEHGKMLAEHGKMLAEHLKMLKSFKKDQNTMLDMLDREQMDQRKRIKRIEERLEINPAIS